MESAAADIIKFSIGTFLVIGGWAAAHYFTNRRDRIAKRRDISLDHLIKAYRVLAEEISHRENVENRQLESIITDIQLFGSEEQIMLAHQLAKDAAQNRHFELDPLINSLRKDLRKKLGLSDIKGNVIWLRFQNSSINTQKK
ncbi:hypothetical protein A8C56_09505 [Niabella ginsenosidivorans]|uniref:Uncharacterized protein n=1 Tax=Niabella ginsenosidivorans TaxID=1176587 RepID=A0A1A9I0N8_9BACT|nr:hypothetical protein [Niabella ginsenosidivorans]ANH81186.1 hypothetical protein A8C56_09505 [Niabella ginsenosidivorans]